MTTFHAKHRLSATALTVCRSLPHCKVRDGMPFRQIVESSRIGTIREPGQGPIRTDVSRETYTPFRITTTRRPLQVKSPQSHLIRTFVSVRGHLPLSPNRNPNVTSQLTYTFSAKPLRTSLATNPVTTRSKCPSMSSGAFLT